jgi:hypothetical protein
MTAKTRQTAGKLPAVWRIFMTFDGLFIYSPIKIEGSKRIPQFNGKVYPYLFMKG